MAIAGDIANLIVALKLDDSQFTGKLRGAQSQLGRFSGGLSQMGRGVGQVSRGLDTLGTRAAIGAAAGLTAVVKTAVDFESAFAGVAKTVEATPAQLEELNEGFREMARTIPLSFEEFAKIGEQAGALGIARKDILAFTKVAAEIGITTDVSSDQAATSLGVLSNVLKLTSEDYDNFGATLVDLGNKGASTESAILAIAERAGAGASLIGVAADETLGWASALANLGIAPEAGGTALQTFFTKSLMLVSKGKDELEVFAKTAGVSKKAFAEMFDQDSSAALEKFILGLGKLEKSERLAVLASLGFKDVRISRAILGLAGDTDNLTGSLNTSNQAWEENTALTAEAEKRYATTASQLTLVKNNVRDAAYSIGFELLPIVKELTGEFVAFLNLDTTQAGLKQFAKDLAGGIRGLVTELRGTDFSGIIGGMKLAASVAKGAFDAFNALPGPVKQFAIAALIANKVSGGAVGQISKGLFNILGGAIKLAFPKLDIFGRGSPANPMFVVPLGGAGLGGVPAAGGKAGSLIGGAAKFVLGPAAAVIIGHEIGQAVFFDPMVRPAVEFETSQFDKFIAAAEGDPAKLARGLAVLEGGIHDIAGNTRDFIDEAVFGDQLQVLDEQVALTKQLLAEAKANAPQAGVGNNVPANRGGTQTQKVFDEHNFNEAAASRRLAQERNRIALQSLGLEQRLIQDPDFKKQISGAEFINLLKRTSEFGARGVGTSIEQGRKTGRDPFGEAFLALVKRVKVLTPEVMREVGNHIVAAEQVQSRLLKQGDLAGARRIQRTIDALHKIQGTQDRTNAILDTLKSQTHSALSVANRNLATNNAKQERIVSGIASARERIGSGFQASNAQLGIIARKKTSFTADVNVTTNVTAHLSTYQALTTLTRVTRIRAGTGFTPQLLNG